MAEKAPVIELGTVTGATEEEEATEMIEGQRVVMLGAMITTVHHAEIEIFLRVALIEGLALVAVDLQEVIEMNLRCRWGVGTGKRAQALLQRRRSRHLT